MKPLDIWAYAAIPLVIVLLTLFVSTAVYARPGNTARCSSDEDPSTECKRPGSNAAQVMKDELNTLKYGNALYRDDSAPQTLWPMVASFKNGNATGAPTTLLLQPHGFKVNYVTFSKNAGVGADVAVEPSRILKDACSLFVRQLFGKRVGRHAIPTAVGGCAALQIRVADLSDTSPQLNVDESYALEITVTPPAITLSANSTYGIIMGLSTLTQLVQIDGGRGWVQSRVGIPTTRFSIPNSPWSIQDSPRFSYRGLMVDTARNFIPLDILKTIVDGLWLSRMNVLHLHAVDSQSFPLYLPSAPELAIQGAYRLGDTPMFYSQRDINELIYHANTRGVRVLCEIDMPAHSLGFAYSHPEIVSNTAYVPSLNAGVGFNQTPYSYEPGAAVLTPSVATYDLLRKVFVDVGNMFPSSVIHIGGDEMQPANWGSCSHEAIADTWNAFFMNVIQNLPKNKGIQMWDGPIFPANESFPQLNGQPDVTFNYWGGSGVCPLFSSGYAGPLSPGKIDPNSLVGRGYKVVDTCVSWYLDAGMGNMQSFTPGWAQPIKTWWGMYVHDPHEWWGGASGLDGANVGNYPGGYGGKGTWYMQDFASAAQLKQIIGGEACMWGETTDYSSVLYQVFPRTCAVAERLWSPQLTAGGAPFFDTTGQIGVNKLCKKVGADTCDATYAFSPGNPGQGQIWDVVNRLEDHITRQRRLGVRSGLIRPMSCQPGRNISGDGRAECNNYIYNGPWPQCANANSGACGGGGSLNCPAVPPKMRSSSRIAASRPSGARANPGRAAPSARLDAAALPGVCTCDTENWGDMYCSSILSGSNDGSLKNTCRPDTIDTRGRA